MITLNDYLYSGDTVFRIIQKYIEDLRKEAKTSRNEVDMMHCNFLIQILELLEHNEFLTVQSQKIRDFYMYMAKKYPYLAFTFKGRIKSKNTYGTGCFTLMNVGDTPVRSRAGLVTSVAWQVGDKTTYALEAPGSFRCFKTIEESLIHDELKRVFSLS